MKEDKLLLDPLWNLEMSSANLKDDIRFLRCIDSEYFQKGNKESSEYLYWHLWAFITILRKSLEYTQTNMKKSIEAIYEEERKNKRS